MKNCLKNSLKVYLQSLTKLIEKRALAVAQCLEIECSRLSQDIDELKKQIEQTEEELQKLTA